MRGGRGRDTFFKSKRTGETGEGGGKGRIKDSGGRGEQESWDGPSTRKGKKRRIVGRVRMNAERWGCLTAQGNHDELGRKYKVKRIHLVGVGIGS